MKKIDLNQSSNRPKGSTKELQSKTERSSNSLSQKNRQEDKTNHTINHDQAGAQQAGIDKTDQISQDQNSKAPESQQEASIFNQLNLDEDVVDMKKRSKKIFIVISLAALIAGAGTGFGAYKLQAEQAQVGEELADIEQVAEGRIKKGDIFGIQDESTFKDSAQGYLEMGGLNGEGSHKLLRPGGESQTVYLTSTVTDLDRLVNMEVKVWGETYKGQKAGWLMDVGKVEVIEPDAEAPVETEL